MEKNKLIILGLVLFCLNSEAAYVVMGNNKGPVSVAIGANATSVGIRSYAIGGNSKSEGGDSYAIGANATSVGSSSYAIGGDSKSEGWDSYAIGAKATSVGSSSYAIGGDSKSEGADSYAIGANATSVGNSSYAIGNGSKSEGNSSYAIGGESKSEGAASYAIGTRATSVEAGSYAIGYEAKSEGWYSYAIGSSAKSEGHSSYAIGRDAKSKSLTSISLGSFSEDKVEESINTKGNIKYNNETVNGVNFEFYEGKSENRNLKEWYPREYDENKFSILSIGNENYNRRIQNLSPGLIGPKSTDAINGSQLYSVIDVLTKTSVNFAGLAGDNHYETIKVKDLGFEFNNGLKAKKVTRDGKEFIVVGLNTTNDGNNTGLGGRGDKGPQGDQGLKGETGDKGPQGDQGLKGETGDKGPQGDQGLKGDTGDKGPQGDQGLKGETGDKGPQGDKGLKGETGDKGPQGDKGPKGDSGDSGFKSQDGKLILEKSQTISNVSDGISPMDVVNKRQLDKVREDLSSRVDIATSGVANALSVASLPQVNSTSGERFNIGVGVGYGMYGGEHSMALGVSGIVGISKGNLMYKLNGSLNSKLKFGLGIGLGYQFGFGSSVNSDSEIEILKKKNERNEARIDELMRIIENMKK